MVAIENKCESFSVGGHLLETRMPTLRFKTYVDEKGEHRWRLLASNGKIVACSGEGYKNRVDMLAEIEQIKQGMVESTISEMES